MKWIRCAEMRMNVKAELKTGSVNQILKGTDIYEEGGMIESVALVVKGRIRMHARGTNIVVGTGSFLGVRDINRGVHGLTYTAQTNAVIYVFRVSGSMSDIEAIIQTNKDYGALMVSNFNKLLSEQEKHCGEFQDASEKAYRFLMHAYQKCQEIGQQSGNIAAKLPQIEQFHPFDEVQMLPEDKIKYYKACNKVATDVQKAFFGASADICIYTLREQTSLLHQMFNYCRAHADYLEQLLSLMIVGQDNLYIMTARLAASMQRMGEDSSVVMRELDDVIDQINYLETLLQDKADVSVDINRSAMEEAYFALLSRGGTSESSMVGASDAELALVEGVEVDASQLDGAMEQILEFAECDSETSERFVGLIEKFQKMPDQEATDDDARNLRRAILKDYYPIYQSVFWKDYHSKEDTPFVVDLFLRYGFLSEKLLSEKLINDLLCIDNECFNQEGSEVFDMKEWLQAIAAGRREPSKNEFDMDYEEMLRDKRKNKEITPQQQEEMRRDQVRKVDFEITNMFRVNHRLVNGQMSIFVPFLYTGGCGGSLQKMFLSRDRLKAAVNRVRRIDFSAFYRESLFTKEVPGIKKEFIQQEVFPDIVIMPTTGSKGIMWQELSGRKRDTPGRFLLPAFLEGDLDKLIVYLVGCFRWELCRTMQGAHWNDIQMKSLTSEYADFLQFYKKNRELSDEKKEKVKLQIQKKRNNTREIFALDYAVWIQSEAKGGILLNKPVREILATYCPFAKEIRENIQEQPVFQAAMARFNRERAKKNKEYELKYRVWIKDQVKVPEEIEKTRDFYRDY